MKDTAKFNDECQKAAMQLSQKAAAFEVGFKSVSALPPDQTINVYVPYEKIEGGVRIAEHKECFGKGKTAQEALDDWSDKLAQLPQSGDRLFWRVNPEIDWSFNFETNAPVWKVYARLAIFETAKDAA